MKTLPLLVWTVLLVLCHFVTVTLGAPTSQVKGHDLTKSFDDLNRPFIDAEECFKDAEEYFQTQGLITSTLSNRALGSKWKDHVYVVQLDPALGKGAGGVVYLAKDIKIPDDFVAIKRTDTLIPEAELKGLELVGIKLGDLAENEYNGRPVYEYWTDENNKGYYTLLYSIGRDIVAPLMNKFLIHNDLTNNCNMIVAQIDENYLPRETDPATSLQHFRAIDFGEHDEIFKAKEIFQNAVIDALDKNKFYIKLAEDGMPIEVRRRRN